MMVFLIIIGVLFAISLFGFVGFWLWDKAWEE